MKKPKSDSLRQLQENIKKILRDAPMPGAKDKYEEKELKDLYVKKFEEMVKEQDNE